jgi:hypothetical protein
MAGDGSLAFRGNAFHAARNVAARTLRPPQQPDTTKPLIVSATGLGTIGPQCGCWLSPDADAAYGDVFMQLGLDSSNPIVITMRFPGTTAGGAPPAAQGLFVAVNDFTLAQANVAGTPTDVQWTMNFVGQAGLGGAGNVQPGRIWRVHYEWNVSH